jgi:iron complex outermembrane receptor protein
MMKLSKVSGAIALGLGITWTVPSALAQTAPADQQLEKIEVTGSSIRRIDTETPSPIQVITADDLKKSGYTTVSEVLRNISANNQGTLSQSFNGAFAAGASGVALRGLTVGATLVLIDGHRSAPYPLSDDGQRSFVDISAIPFDAIESIEILKDGASSIYGSDAIAGVVNVKLKKSFSGTSVNAEGGISSHGDGRTTHFSITHGAGDLDADGHTGFFSAEYRHQDQILLVDRPGSLTLRDYTPFGGVNATPGVANAANGGFPGSIYGYTVNPNTGAVTSQLTCKATNSYGPNCPYPLNNALQIQPGTRNINLLAKGTQALPDNWKLGVTLSMFSSSAEQIGNYASTGGFGGLYGIQAGPGVPVPTVFPAAGPVYVTVPSTGDLLFSDFTGAGVNRNEVNSQTYRLITELTGNQFGWNLDGTIGLNKAILHSQVSGDISIPGVASILSGLPASTTAAQLNSILQNPGINSIISPLQTATSSSEVDYLTLRGDREIYQLPGGPVSLALGGEYTHHALTSLAPGGVAAGVVPGNDAFAVGQQNIASAYFELDAQVLKNFEADFSMRYDHVDTYGSSTTPKLGLKYTPIEQVTLRGTYSQGFRAPNPAEAGNAGQAFLYLQTNDPILCPGGGKAANDVSSQCNIVPTFYQQSNAALQPEKSHEYTLGLIFEPVRGYSATFDYYHIKLDNQITSAINAAPVSSLIGNAVRGPAGATYATEGGGTITPTTGLIEFIPVPYINANTLITTGLDVDLRGKLNLHEFGEFSTDFSLTRVFKYELTSPAVGTVELAGTHGPSGISGDTGTPQNRIVWQLSWDKGPLDITAIMNYISAYSVTDPASGLNDCLSAIDFNFNGSFTGASTPTSNTCNVSSFTTFDFTTRYKYDKSLTFYGAINNAFDRQAPLDLETYGGSNYNPSLHAAGAIGRMLSAGIKYDF